MKLDFRLDGGRQLLDTLAGLPKPLQTRVLRNVMREALEPIAAQVKADAPVLWGDLEEDLHIGVKLNKRQTSLNRENKKVTQLHFGTNDPAGMMNEFGTSEMPAQPFFRSAWEGGKFRALETIKSRLGEIIVRSAARHGKRKARKG